MNGTVPPTKNPSLLLETARVFNAAGPPYENAAPGIAFAALKELKPDSDPEMRDAVTGDVAALNLSGRLPGGYDEALKLLAPIDDAAKHPDKEGRLHLLRALANGQKYTALRETKKKAPADRVAALDAQLEELKKSIREDLKQAFKRNADLRASNRRFWDPDSDVIDEVVEKEADLRAVYEDDPEFHKLVNPPPQSSTSNAVNPPP
jgi:hypothetical protein